MAGLRIGFFGGTFDPPHIGHSILAEIAYQEVDLDLVLWVLTPDPPHKLTQRITQLGPRVKMVEAAIRADPRFKFSHVDIDRQPPFFAVDTLHILRQEYPDDQLFYIMGGDSLNDLPTWHTPLEFLNVCDGLVVMLRPGYEVSLTQLMDNLPGLQQKLILLKAPLLEISSTHIRKLASQKKSFRYYLLPSVFRIILKLNLY
jgi:nicotinate-nucleotide adenylyltransferase